jgi:UDP-glucuronate 4-epimerase
MAATSQRNILVTGGAGFIGSHLVDRALAHGDRITVLDNFNDFYSASTKRANIKEHTAHQNYKLIEGDLRDPESLQRAFAQGPFDVVVHLAAMAGVRPSLENPALYMDVNVNGTQFVIDHILKSSPNARFVFGSSSSVYGGRSGECFVETDRVDQPLSPYAASKAANELQCYAAHHTRGLQVVSLRFFTVFGPRQRPDLAIHKFTAKIDRGEQIEVFGDGTSKRDYTFVFDIIEGVWSAMQANLSGFEIINLGRSEPVILMDMIRSIETALGKEARIVHKPFQTGDVPYTYASIEKARQLLGYNPKTPLNEGIKQFVDWYRSRLDTSLPLRP